MAFVTIEDERNIKETEYELTYLSLANHSL